MGMIAGRLPWTMFQTCATSLARRLGLAVLLLPPAINAAPPDPIEGGAIAGTVHITEKLTEQRMRFSLYPGSRPAPPPPEQGARSDEYRNIVIYLKSDAPVTAAPEERAHTMAQEGEAFTPHVLPITVGSTVSFPNLDPIFHNVFSLSATRTFDLGRYPQGDSKSVTFERTGLVPVFCHIHSDMSAIILVLDNPLYTVPDNDGRYRIENIPPGNYTLVAWHERSEPVEHAVQLQGGQILSLDITVPLENEQSSPP